MGFCDSTVEEQVREAADDDNINQTLMIAKAYLNLKRHRISLDIEHYTEGVAQFKILDAKDRVIKSSF